jgi:site-specific DNA-methyltransferase (adenine-specific)
MLAYALRDDGWFLRMDLIWSKRCPMPERVTDRPTKAHEYVFLLSKSERYFYDWESIKTNGNNGAPASFSSEPLKGNSNNDKRSVASVKKARGHVMPQNGLLNKWDKMTREEQLANGANKRSVWSVEDERVLLRWLTENHAEVAAEFMNSFSVNSSVIDTAPARFSSDHYAVFPERLVQDMIKAGCPIGGTVLDPFFGRGTTALVSAIQGKSCVGIEIVPENITIATNYLREELGLLADIEVLTSGSIYSQECTSAKQA